VRRAGDEPSATEAPARNGAAPAIDEEQPVVKWPDSEPAAGANGELPAPKSFLNGPKVFFGEYAAFAREISRALREHKVTVRITNKTMEEWLEAVSAGTVDLVLGRWVADYPDADSFASILATKEGLLGPVCGLAEMDRLIV
jgi:ABC-type oligopeptide transport system substrate-binding subunit